MLSIYENRSSNQHSIECNYSRLYFTDEETDTQKSCTTFPKPQGWSANPDFTFLNTQLSGFSRLVLMAGVPKQTEVFLK